MKYTLDSLHQVETALQEKHRGAKLDTIQVILSGDQLAELAENERKVYFGVLTIPPGVKCNLTNRGNEVITVDSGSQIIECFTAAEFLDNADLAITPKGQFRGSIIQLDI